LNVLDVAEARYQLAPLDLDGLLIDASCDSPIRRADGEGLVDVPGRILQRDWVLLRSDREEIVIGLA
jgi:hypothetical protein